MNTTVIRGGVLRALARVAPEVDTTTLRFDLPLREQVDIDSMDYLNFLIELQRESGVDVPEVDYAKVATLDALIAYVAARAAA